MKSLVKSKAEPGLWMEEVIEPRIGPNDILIRIRKTAICGTDIHIYNWDEWSQKTIPIPMTIGHEFVGIVEQVGREVVGFSVGDRVSGEGHITCGHCRNCRAGKRHLCRNTQGVGVNRPGCFAELLSIPAFNAFGIPDAIEDDLAAILDPLGNATHSALSFDLVGEDVLITGAGPIGCMSVAICRYVGARHVVITDLNDYRLDLAAKLGASRTVNIKHQTIKNAFTELGMLEGFDIGLEMSGNPDAFRSLLESINYGGHVAILGIPPRDTQIDWDQVIFKGLFLKGIYGREMFETWYKMSSMLQAGLHISPVITHHFSIGDFQEAFKVARSGQSGKVVLDWNSQG